MVRRVLKSCSPMWAMLIPSMWMAPLVASIRRNNAKDSEDLPAPVRPTTPTWPSEKSERQLLLLLLVGYLTSHQHAGVSQGRICLDDCKYCHTETKAVYQSCYLAQSQYTDIGLTSPSTDPTTPGACQDSHWNTSFQATDMT